MSPYELIHADCLFALTVLEDNSVDSIVTDPPYELGFMGKAWDATGIANSVEMWREALRVLKPGGHLLAFSGSRTYHRMTCAIEDAGFDIRDQIMWIYGSGFPKSLDVGQQLQKFADTGFLRRPEVKRGGSRATRGSAGGAVRKGKDVQAEDDYKGRVEITDSCARQWEGWGTALKPAHEPICVARKPLIGTVAANVLAHGTGALNIDGCRVHSGDSQGYAYTVQRMAPGADQNKTGKTHQEGVAFEGQTKDGRWPANLIHDGSDEVLAAFPDAKGQQGATAARSQGVVYGTVNAGQAGIEPRNDVGSASRFFYCAKTSKADRGTENVHPTVKPTDLMAYLVRLVTPPGGLVLDPFMGSGSTGKAAMREGFQFIGIEMDATYIDIARARIEDEYIRGLA